MNLLHYNKEYGSYVSQVDDKRFFYAEDGSTNPQAELIETIKNLFQKTDNPNQQTQCRFVARSRWLSEQLDIKQDHLPKVHCDEYLEWRKLTQADSVTMIFPAYHLNSPSSMFGHTLLRLDNASSSKSEWLSFAVNFGADINNDDNSLIYAYRGLAGGYPGIFITEPYFKKIQEYNRIEHRDIWEYKLNLSPEETQTMIDHLWELKTINFDYYFFDENCSYRLLELLEVARPDVELTDEFILTAIPVDTVRAIKNAKLIKSVSYRPARASRIQYTLTTMDQQQRTLVLKLAEDINILQSDDFASLPTKEQKQIVDLAYKYLRYQKTKQARDPASAKRSHRLLQKLNDYPVEIDISNTMPVPSAPEEGHKSKRATLALGQRLNNNYAELGFKMAFHDLEDNKEGFLQGAQINIGSIKIRAEDNVGLRLYQLDFVDIFSLTPRDDFFNPLSWKINTGFERQLTKDKDQLVYQLSGGAGGTWQIIKNHQFYALATGRLEINKQLKNFFEPAIGFNTGFLSHFKNTTAHLEFSGEQLQENIYRLRVQYTQNYSISTNHSIKLFAKHQWQDNGIEFSDINLNYQYYF
ncbi:MAG: DUF4105 domain-containing protein [Bacteroidales bacterium]|nr:DUF4105 domain-containing protein [Bacteroidales bacterium]